MADLLRIASEESPIEYDKLKILAADDFPDMRQYMKTLLMNCGARREHITTVDSPADAIRHVKQATFDIILCDYEFGDGKDGQQLLEQMRIDQLISLSTAFVMVTGNASYKDVAAAAEYGPDGYILKPLKTDVLKAYLDKILPKKKIFNWVYEQLGKGHNINAIAKCDEIIKRFPAYRIDALRLKAELLITMGKFSEAEALYQVILDSCAIPWAQFGMAKVLDSLGRKTESEQLLNTIITDSSKMVAASDYLADMHSRQGNWDIAQEVLQRSINVSSKSVPRQRKLAEVAVQNGDFATAKKALEAVVKEKHGSLFKPSDVATFVELHLREGNISAARSLLESEQRLLRSTKEGSIAYSVSMAATEAGSNNTARARQHIDDALHAKKTLEINGVVIADTKLLEHMAGTCKDLGLHTVASSIENELRAKNPSRYRDESIQTIIEVKPDKPVEEITPPSRRTPEETKALVQKIIGEAKVFFDEKNLDAAYQKFFEIMVLTPDSFSGHLNLTITIVHILNKQSGINESHQKLIAQGRESIEKMGRIAPKNESYLKVQATWEMLEKKFGICDTTTL